MPVRSMGEGFFSIRDVHRLAYISSQIEEVSRLMVLGKAFHLLEGVWKVAIYVIASEAKQSVAGKEIASSPPAPRNDTFSPFSKHPLGGDCPSVLDPGV